MKRFTIPLLIFLVLFSSCTKDSPSTSDSTITITDDLGRTVEIGRVERVAHLIGSFADVWCLAGGKDQIVAAADDTWTQFDLGLPEETVRLGAVKAPSLEMLISSDPDLVIASGKTGADVALMDTLEEMGIPVLYFSVSNFDDYLRMLDAATDITGKKENYEKYGTALRKQIDDARAMADGTHPTVLYLRASSSSVRVKNSEKSILGEMLRDLGCINIADSEASLLDALSMETIIKEDPDYIFCVLQGSVTEKAQQSLEKAVLSNPLWESLTAVREGRFYMMDQKLYNMKPNARWGEAYEKLAEILYGDK